MLLLVVGGAAAWWINGTMPADPSDRTTRNFSVNKGEGIREIANDLKAQGLIRDSVAFFLLVKQQRLDGKIQAGEFHLSPAMSAAEIARALQVGTFDIQITFPEGKRAEEIADILKEHMPTYDESWRQMLSTNEGYLFPDTYSLPKDADITAIVTAMRNNFDQKYAQIPTVRTDFTKEDIVKIASLVEREARHDEDRPLVASVIINRLKINMKLDIDATIQYALGYNNLEKTWWKKNLTIEDIRLEDPYNTYETQGLPPTPISNPGLAVLKAVNEAPETDYIYYLSDDTGHNHYSKTLAEHHANVKKYLE